MVDISNSDGSDVVSSGFSVEISDTVSGFDTSETSSDETLTLDCTGIFISIAASSQPVGITATSARHIAIIIFFVICFQLHSKRDILR